MPLHQKAKKLFLTTTAIIVVITIAIFLIAKNGNKKTYSQSSSRRDTIVPKILVNKGDSIVDFAEKLMGVPYKYATSSPEGFDCSGFVYYVFSHFKIPIERSSYTMAEGGNEIDSSNAHKGDLIFFRGTNLDDNSVGHVGIIISEEEAPLEFIHASSGKKKNGVVKTKLSDSNYIKRYIMIRRYF